MATIAFMVGGVRTASKNLWAMQDDGSTISVAESYDIGTTTNVRAIVQDADGSYYIATAEKKVYKYNSSMALVTTWGTSGVVTLGDVIYGLAVDSAGYLAVAHDEYDTPDKTLALYDNTGTLVWHKDYQTKLGIELTGACAFDSGGAVVGIGSRSASQPIANRYARADGAQEQGYATAVGGIYGYGIHVTGGDDIIVATNTAIPSTIVLKRESDDTLVWTTTLSENTTSNCMVVDSNDENSFFGCSKITTNTLFRLNENGTENATYNTGGTFGINGIDFDANGNLITACISGTDENGNLGTIRVLDTDFNLLRVYNDVSVISVATAVVAGISFKISTQAPVGAYKTYSRKLVAVSNNKIKYESAADTFTEVSAATNDIDVTKPLDAFELDEKIFIVNKTNLKVLDFGNYKIQTDDIVNAGGHAYPLRKVIITGAGGAEMWVDYITAIDGAAYIYGVKLNSTAFVDGELVTGTNSDATTVNFNIKSGTTEVDPDPPHWYDWTVYGGSSVYGVMPEAATMGCNWNGSAILAGNPYYPHQWYKFENGNPWNVNWIALDALAPVIGNDADAGETGDLIVGLIPYKDDFLIHGCAGSLWYNVGDPASGGSLLELSLTAGMLGRDAFCWDKNDNLYILGTTGILKIPKGFGPPENLTEETYPNFIKDLAFNSAIHTISMGYDPQRHGIKIYRTTYGDGGNTGWWFDLRKQGLFPESVPTNAAPYCMFYYNSVNPTYTGLLSGCTDGFIRAEDDAETNDDVGDSEAAINSYATFGPIKLGNENREGILNSINVITTGSRVGTELIDSSKLVCKVWTGLASDDIYEGFKLNTSPKLAAVISAPGRNRGGGIRRPVRGVYCGVRIENETLDETWGLEEIVIEGGPAGKV